MKKHIIFLLLIVSVGEINAQQMLSPIQKVNKDYFKKSKKEKKTAWILLGGGTVIFTGGVIAMQHSQSKGGIEFPFVLGGMAMTISSAPFFISSAINKHKATLALRKQALQTRPGVNNNIYQTSASLKISF